ncbi:hypothetical protein FRB96_001956 [Tulasnella sp. 330]|nr:hypothetical protein FRB96_001956 [Tulasnella sp. 330]KAG8867707.1 hypothetical protein FRB98_004041 [Tulasnella sp. 332]KAG8867940.1 hypothetical protein FRB97_002876 [Tulasnella sp. 331]
MDALTKNVAGDISGLNQQKGQMQQEAQIGGGVAEIAAKLPVGPETFIEGVMMWRRTAETITANIVPIVCSLAVAIALLAYEMLVRKITGD